MSVSLCWIMARMVWKEEDGIYDGDECVDREGRILLVIITIIIFTFSTGITKR